MHLEVTFRNLNPREEVRRRAQALFDKFDRFLDPAAHAQMVINVEHGLCSVEIVVMSHGTTYKSVEEDADLRTSLDRVMHAMEQQLRRAKEHRSAGRRDGAVAADGFVRDDDEEPSAAG